MRDNEPMVQVDVQISVVHGAGGPRDSDAVYSYRVPTHGGLGEALYQPLPRHRELDLAEAMEARARREERDRAVKLIGRQTADAFRGWLRKRDDR